MKNANSGGLILVFIIIAFGCMTCAGNQSKNSKPREEGPISVSNRENLEKNYLAEGFISDDIYRVVIVSSKDAGIINMETLKNKAVQRARLSLERALSANNINYNKNTKIKIMGLINSNGHFVKKNAAHKRYDVYYFEITKKGLKNYLLNSPSPR